MASAAVEELIEDYIGANWTHAPILQVNEDNETPSDGTPFLVLQYPLSNVTRATMNQPCYREEGGVRILINVPRGEGTALIRQWGAELAALLREKRLGDLRLGIPTEPFTDNESDEGNYFTGAMICDYTYDFVG